MSPRDWKFYPKDWNGTRWVRYDLDTVHDQIEDMPYLPGCYVIYLDGQLAYVGQSQDVRTRLRQYGFRLAWSPRVLCQWGQFKSAYVKIRYAEEYGDWAMRELKLLKRLRPRLNSMCVNRKRRVVVEDVA